MTHLPPNMETWKQQFLGEQKRPDCHVYIHRFFLMALEMVVYQPTPLKINMEHQNHPIEKEHHLLNLHIWVPC